ncbi:type VI secretion system baseplate subunit TssK, partial [Pseudomonas syringae pv. tagetis]|uniref:type VI secretion system baseplate subunit TssK n=1 Tax=Pseudomonas syringae group genomosp. 7 TaxID=251699 RepID=UPI00376F8C2D
AYTLRKLGHVLFCSPHRTITLDAGFSPAFISVSGSRYLMSCLKEIVGLLQHRGDLIAERIGAYGQASGAEMGDFLMLL